MAVSVASMARKCFAVAVAGAAAMGRAATRLLCETDAQSMRFDPKMLQEEIFLLFFTKKQNFPKMVGRRVFPLGTQSKDPLFRPFDQPIHSSVGVLVVGTAVSMGPFS